MPKQEPKQDVIWIKTDLAVDGSGYVASLEVGDDTARVLTPREALSHAYGVLAAVGRAEYDVAVAKQLTRKLKVNLEAALQIVSDLRADRPPLDPADTFPLVIEPGVNARLKPFLAISCKGMEKGQWDMEQARGHAMAVLTVASVADLDSGYLRCLVSTVGIDRNKALQVVDDLQNYR